MCILNRIQISDWRKVVCLFAFLVCKDLLFCQGDTVKKEPYVYFNAVSAITGFSLSEYQSHSVDYFKKLAPDNSILKSIPTNTEKRTRSNNSGNAAINFGLNLHLKTKDFKTRFTTFSSEWRMGINVSTNINERYVCSKKTTIHTDTFYSSHTGMVIYESQIIDSIYQFNYRSDQVYFDLTKTYHTNQHKWISFYTGINFGIGYTYNNSLSIASAIDTSKNGELREKYYKLDRYYSTNSETKLLNSELYYNASIPIGVLLRSIIKENPLKFRFSFFAEGRFGYRFQKNYSNTYSKTPLGTIQVGLKVYFKR